VVVQCHLVDDKILPGAVRAALGAHAPPKRCQNQNLFNLELMMKRNIGLRS